jgi:hypothetical protein
MAKSRVIKLTKDASCAWEAEYYDYRNKDHNIWLCGLELHKTFDFPFRSSSIYGQLSTVKESKGAKIEQIVAPDDENVDGIITVDGYKVCVAYGTYMYIVSFMKRHKVNKCYFTLGYEERN